MFHTYSTMYNFVRHKLNIYVKLINNFFLSSIILHIYVFQILIIKSKKELIKLIYVLEICSAQNYTFMYDSTWQKSRNLIGLEKKKFLFYIIEVGIIKSKKKE